jgi:hypothetical protein
MSEARIPGTCSPAPPALEHRERSARARPRLFGAGLLHLPGAIGRARGERGRASSPRLESRIAQSSDADAERARANSKLWLGGVLTGVATGSGERGRSARRFSLTF